MYKSNTFLEFISKQAVAIYLPGYRNDKNELSSLRKFLTKEKKISFFSLSYSLQDTNGKEYSIKEVISEIEKTIKSGLDRYHFKKCYLIGYSLGAALALKIVSRNLFQFDRLILLSIFDDRKGLLRERGIDISDDKNVSPIDLIKKIKKTPMVFIHGAFDASIRTDRALKVYKESNSKKARFILLPADHHFSGTGQKKLLQEQLNEIIGCP
jgi:predicted esterase